MSSRKPVRTQENVIDTNASGIAWFQMAAALEEFGSALAKPCSWDEANRRWKVIPGERRRNVYSTVEGITAAEDEFVPCWYNPAARGRWEVIVKPATSPPITQFSGVELIETSLSTNRVSPSDSGSLEFHTRLGPSDCGVTHDNTVATATADGNFTVTNAGIYRISMYLLAQTPATWGTAGIHLLRMQMNKKTPPGGFQSVQGDRCYCWDDDEGVGVNVDNPHQAATTFLSPLKLGDKLRILLNAFGPSTDEWELTNATVSFQRVAEYVDPVSI